MQEIYLDRTIERGEEYPYDTQEQNQDWTFKAARTIIADLTDRGGIKHGFNDIDEDIRNDIVEAMATYIKECHTRFKDNS